MFIRKLATVAVIGSMFAASVAQAGETIRPSTALPAKANTSSVFSNPGVSSNVRAGKIATANHDLVGIPFALLAGFAVFTGLVIAVTGKSSG
ncbi:MAG: hypothetical protein RLZZ08_1048 [Pseudomonadota bacterium]|jgi:hypothetical protein